MKILDILFQFWIDGSWFIALAMSMVVNTLVYFVTAFVLSGFIEGMVKSKIGEFIDNRALKNGQSKREML